VLRLALAEVGEQEGYILFDDGEAVSGGTGRCGGERDDEGETHEGDEEAFHSPSRLEKNR
jgi:hypothetical protein